MASRRAMANIKGMMLPLIRNSRSIGTVTGTVPKMKAYAPSVGEKPTCVGATKRPKSLKEELIPKGKPLGDYVPVYVALGMITLSVSLGLYTAKQELLHSPDVRVKRSRRETLPEVVEPEHVAHESEDYLKKSLFRKVAHIQEFETILPNPVLGDPLSKEPRVESLKTVGVNPI